MYPHSVMSLGARVSRNMVAALKSRLGRDPGVSDVMRLGFANGTAQRLLAGDSGVGTKTIERLADALDLEPWQLLVEGMDPVDMPQLVTAHEQPGWPFDFEAERFRALLPKEQGMVEHAARVELERIEQRRRSGEPPVAEHRQNAA